jgi:hypothetical protein
VGVKTAPKHQVPTEVGVKASEVAVAVEPVPVAAFVLTKVSLVVHETPDEDRAWHTRNATLPVGGPPVGLPVMVTESVAVPVGPMTTELGEAVVLLDEVAGVTVKHSVSLCCGTSV